MMLVLLGVTIVMLAGTVSFLSNQFSVGANQEQEERSFQVAEAGAHYALFLLNEGVYTTEELLAMQTTTQPVVDNGETRGEFTLTFSSVAGTQSGDAIQVVSSGRDASRDICQTLVVVIHRTDIFFTSPYEITSWDHAVTCDGYAS